MNRAVQNFLILLVISTICLGIFELTVRHFAPQDILLEEGLFVNDYIAGYKCAPNFSKEITTPEYTYTIHTNSQGFRDKDHSKAKAQGIYRILILGNSHAFGCGVNEGDTFARRLEKMFTDNAGSGYEVMNMGVPASSTDNQYMYLMEYGVEYHPDLVIVAFYVDDVQGCFMGPDRVQIVDGLKYVSLKARQKWMRPIIGGRLTEDMSLVPGKGDILGWGLTSGVKRFFGRYFHAFHFLRNNYSLIRSSLTFNRFKSPYNKMTLFSTAPYFLKNYPPEIDTGWKITEDYLLKIRDLANKNGAEMAIMAIPANFQADKHHWKAEKARYSLLESQVDLGKPQRILAEFAEDNRIALLDLLPKFKEYASAKELYMRTDANWTKEGHELAAEELYKFLTNEYYQ